jgi:flagellar motility protein MotE (MotC chaperone)
MNPIVKGALLLVGGTTLFVGSFVGVALMSGRPAHEIPLLKNFAQKPEKPQGEKAESAHAEDVTHEPVAQHEETHETPVSNRHADESVPTKASVLSAFVMPAPFNSDELAQMQSKLALRLEEAEVKLATAKDKERALDERERALTGREKELQAIKNELDTRTKELAMREQELGRDGEANAAREEKSWTELARFFAEGEVDDLVKKLTTFDPKDAAKILHQLDDERAIALVNGLPQDQYKSFLDAYRKSVK